MAQKTIDFEKDILEPIDTLKQGLSAESDARKKDVQTLDDNKITKFYTSNQGQKVLNDSDDGKIQDLMIYGKSEQKQYKGKNLLNILKRNTTSNGIVYTVNDDGTVILNGTASDVVDIVVSSSFYIEKGKAYRMTGWVKGQAGILYMLNLNEAVSDNGDGITFVYNGDTTDAKVIHVQCQKNTVFHNVVIKPMIVNASIYPDTTYNDYEPYTGGKPSPSPEFPQEIKAVVNPVIKTHGINLLDIKDVTERVFGENGLTYSVKQGVIKVKGTATSSSAIGIRFLSGENKKITANNTYIFSPNPTKKVESTECYLDFTNNKNFGFSLSNSASINKPVNVQEAQALYLFVLFVRVQKGAKIDMEWKPQLIISNTLLPYQPYQETQATLPYELYAIPVSSGGNVTIDGQQYIADYVDVEKGVLVRNVNHVTLKGITARDLIGNNYLYFFEIGAIAARSNINNGYCRYYIADGSLNDKRVRIDKTRIYIRDDSITNKSEFDSKYENGLEFAYVLGVPEKVDLTQDQIEAFKALSTYYPKTYISAESEQLEAYTMFNYPVSMEKGWEYVKQQIGDTRKYVYDMDLQSAEAYVNSEYAVALTELEV